MCNPQRMSLVDARGVHAAHAAEENERARAAAFVQRQHAALDSQLRIATETGARLQREKKALLAR